MRFATVFFRVAVSAHVLVLLAQPMLIGLFLSGGDEAKLHAHEMVGNSVGATFEQNRDDAIDRYAVPRRLSGPGTRLLVRRSFTDWSQCRRR